MGWFHAIAAESAHLPSVVWHLCPKTDYDEKASIYYPKAYDKDKFTRATHEPSRLMETANCFYKESIEQEWVCLELDIVGLKVNGIETIMETSATDKTLKCPHIFGGIPRECVRKVYAVQRANDGTFLFVKGLTDACTVKK